MEFNKPQIINPAVHIMVRSIRTEHIFFFIAKANRALQPQDKWVHRLSAQDTIH